MHHWSETEEERGGSHLKPDIIIRDFIPNKKAKELILLHEDDIHFNIIVHKTHNVYYNASQIRKHSNVQHNDNTTLFGDIISPQAAVHCSGS